MRGHNEGSLFYRKRDRRWVAAVTMADGSRPTRSAPTRAEGKRLLDEMLRLRDAGAQPADSKVTLGQYLARWLEDVRPNMAPATWRKHESIARCHLIPDLGHVRLSELSVGDVRGYIARASTVSGAQSVRHHRATLRRALADALRDGLVARNVAGLAEPPPLRRDERAILTPEQARTLIDGTRDDRLHALWVLAVTTGMRSAEMLGLTWADIHMGSDADWPDAARAGAPTRAFAGSSPATTQPHITVRQTLQRVDHEWQLRDTKTVKSRRTIPLPPVTRDALAAHRERQRLEGGGDGLVFTTETGRPIHGSNLLPLLRAHLERLGLPKVGVHDLRHSAATILFGAGVPIEVVADILGHSTSRVTADLYRHRIPALSEDAARRMQEAVG